MESQKMEVGFRFDFPFRMGDFLRFQPFIFRGVFGNMVVHFTFPKKGVPKRLVWNATSIREAKEMSQRNRRNDVEMTRKF